MKKQLGLIALASALIVGISIGGGWAAQSAHQEGSNAMLLAGNGHGPGDGTGNGSSGPRDGTGHGPGDCSVVQAIDNSLKLAGRGNGHGHGPGDGTGNGSSGPRDGSGNGPGDCTNLIDS